MTPDQSSPNSLYHLGHIGTFPLGASITLAYDSDNRRVVELPPDALRLLRYCHGAKTLARHVDYCCQCVSRELPLDSVAATIAYLVQTGLLRLTPVVTDQGTHRPSPRTTIRTIGIVTADRPTYVERCVASMVDRFRTSGRSVRFVLVDGSQKSANATATRASLARAAQEFPFRYIGTREADALCTYLEQSGFDRAVVRLALMPGSIGANRNLLQAATAGETILMVDDDVLWRPWTLAESSATLLLTGHDDPRVHRYFGSRPEAFSSAPPSDVDLLNAHESLLSRRLTDFLSTPDLIPNLHNACSHLLALLEQPEKSIVPVTMTGIAGDSALHCHYALLFSSGRVLQMLQADDAQFATALSSREVHRIAVQPTVTHDSACMAYCLGLSNIVQLPPFMPIGRNEDAVFGAMVSFTNPTSLFGHVPYGIFHDSPRPSAYDPTRIASVSETRISDIVLSLIKQTSASVLSADTDGRRRRLAEALIDASGLPQRDFEAWVAHSVLGQKARDITRLDAALAAPASSYPPYWSASLHRYRSALLRAVTDPDFFVPTEFRNRDKEDAWSDTQTFLSCFGRLIAVWPQMLLEAARQFRTPSRLDQDVP